MAIQSTTNNGVDTFSNNEAAPLTEDDAAAAFLSKWSDEDNKSSSQTSAEIEEEEEQSDDPEHGEQDADEAEQDVEESEDAEEDPQEADEESTDESEDSPKQDDNKKKSILEDEAVVKLKVDDQELEVSVKDLKRLYGQEAALTRKGQEVSAKRKEVESAGVEVAAVLDRMFKKAEERWKPYTEIDMLVASKQLDADTFAALRKEAQAAYEDYRFISEEAKGFITKAEQNKQRVLQQAAQEAVKVLKQDIPTWSSSLYDSIREYAISIGMDADVVNNLVDPVAIKALHKARLYDESKKIATKKKVVAPKKVIKSTNTLTASDSRNERVIKAKKQVMSSGTVDDATSLFMARWESDD